jgi:transposase
MNPYPDTIRKGIIEALEADKESQTATAISFGVSLSFVQKLWRRWRETGSYAAKPYLGRTYRSLQDDEDKIRAAIASRPDLSLTELCKIVKDEGGASVSSMTMSRELKRLQLPLGGSRKRLSGRVEKED